MADTRQYEPPAIQKFLATPWGTAARMLFSVALTVTGISTAVGAHDHGSVFGTGLGVALTLSGLLSAVRHAGVLSGRLAAAPSGPKLVTVATFPTKDEARSTSARLRAVGVRSMVSGREIVVRAREADRARQFLGVPPPAGEM